MALLLRRELILRQLARLAQLQGVAAEMLAAAKVVGAARVSSITASGGVSAGEGVDYAAADVPAVEVCSLAAALSSITAAEEIATTVSVAAAAHGIGVNGVNSVAVSGGVAVVVGGAAVAVVRPDAAEGGVAAVAWDVAAAEGGDPYSGCVAPSAVGAAACSASLVGVPAATVNVPWTSLFSTAEERPVAAPRSAFLSGAPAVTADTRIAVKSSVEPSAVEADSPTVFNVNLNASWLDIMEAEFDLSTFDFPSLLPRRLSAWS
jgi:hypothetical protein